MFKFKNVFLVLLICLPPFMLFAQDRPLIAVPGLSAAGVSEVEASTLRSMLETGLVKSDRFNVLSYNDVEAILEAQAFSLSGCVDDSCAIEVGQLLSAEIIVLGELSRIGEGYALNVRMIDVTSSRTLGAEAVNFQSPGEMRDAGFTAAFGLAGLKYVPGSETGIQEFGELYISAPESKAMSVVLDGQEVGITPLLLREVPFGVHLLQVSDGDYHFEQEISVNSKDITEIVADTALLKGNLLLTVDPPILKEYLLEIDGQPHNLGLISDLPAGKRRIEIAGPGWSYYGEVTIKTGETIQTTLPLQESGWIKVEVPLFSRLVLKDDLGRPITLSAGEEKIVPVGTYTLFVEHDNYKSHNETVSIRKMTRHEKILQLDHTRSYELRMEIAALEEELELSRIKRKKMQTVGWIFSGLGTCGMGVLGLGEYKISDYSRTVEGWIDEYATATDPDRINELGINISDSGEELDTWRVVRNSSLIGGAALLLIGGGVLLSQPDIHRMEEALASKKLRLEREENNE